MQDAGWLDIWNVVLAHLRAEPAPLQILIGLGVAFLVLMIAEGLRACFRPSRRPPPERALRPMAAAPVLHEIAFTQKPAPRTPFRPRGRALMASPKRQTRRRRQRMLRPRINRPQASLSAEKIDFPEVASSPPHPPAPEPPAL